MFSYLSSHNHKQRASYDTISRAKKLNFLFEMKTAYHEEKRNQSK